MELKRLCVFAGSNLGNRGAYAASARELGRALADRGIGLVYGGARVGLMGALANELLTAGGHVIGIIPEALVAKEVAHEGLTELRIVRSMHERKAMMADLADGFIALPGGWGTVEELFEILTWGQLGLHRKPCGLLNAAGYFDPMLSFVEHSIEEGFVRREYLSMITASDAAGTLIDRLQAYEPPVVEKWIERAET
jgi:uncharacterized protein (TIGR00730 family)